MKKNAFIIFILFFILIITMNTVIYANDQKQQNWAISYINNSPFIFSASASLIFSFSGMIEMNMGQFYFGQIPLNYCFALIPVLFVQGSSLSFAFSPAITIHLGLSSVPLEFVEGIGLGVGFEASNELKPVIGFTALFQLNYYLSKNNGIFINISYISGMMNWGLGIFFNTTGGKK